MTKDKKPEKELDTRPLQERLEEPLAEFSARYFEPLSMFIDEEHAWMREHGVRQKNNADYFGLRRFIFTAINNMIEMDNNIKTDLFGKLQQDIDGLYKYYDHFAEATKYPKVICDNEFLPSLPLYMDIKNAFEQALADKARYDSLEKKSRALVEKLSQEENLSKDDQDKLKFAKRQNADSIHNLANAKEQVGILFEQEKVLREEITDIFFGMFMRQSAQIKRDLIAVINMKSYSLDKALWYYAEKSISIKRFFRTAQIKGNFSLTTYIDYYLKNINVDVVTNDEEIKFLMKAMKDLETKR